jgi:hypothetical protein
MGFVSEGAPFVYNEPAGVDTNGFGYVSDGEPFNMASNL